MNSNRFFSELMNNMELKEEFKKDPKSVLQKNGVPWNDKREIEVCEEKPGIKYIVIRQVSEIDDKILDQLPENQRSFFKQLYQSLELKEKFKQNPRAVFKSFQIDVPDGYEIIVLEDTEDVIHIVMPDISEVSEAELAQISGGLGVFGEIVGGLAAGLLGMSPLIMVAINKDFFKKE